MLIQLLFLLQFLCLFPLPLLSELVVAVNLLAIGWKGRNLLAQIIDLEWKSIINCWLRSKSLILFFLFSLSFLCSLLSLLYFWFLFSLSVHLPLQVSSPVHPILDEGGQHEQGEDAFQQPNVPDYLHLAVVHGRHAVLRETFLQNPFVVSTSLLVL